MKQTIVIKPAQGISISTQLHCSYMHPEKKEQVTLTMDKRIVWGALKETDKPFRFKFSKYMSQYVNETNTETDKIALERADNEKLFWSKHPSVKIIGGENRHLRNELFVMEVLEDTEKNAYESSKKRLMVMNIVNNLDEKTRYDLCFFFGGNPTNKTDWQIWNDLIAMEGGKILEKENMDKFIEMMGDVKKEEMVARTIIKKAIHYGVIVTESNKYWTKQRDLLGMNEDDIFLYYKSNADAFNYIKQEVSTLDVGYSSLEKKKSK